MAKKKEEEGEEKPAKPLPRYVASLQSTDDPSCYKDFFEGEVGEEAKKEAEAASQKNKRNALVFDRKVPGIIAKFVVERPAEEKKPEAAAEPAKKAPRKKEPPAKPPKVWKKEDYF